MDLGGEEAAEHHGAAQTDGDAHGSGLHLYSDQPDLTCSDKCIIQPGSQQFVTIHNECHECQPWSDFSAKLKGKNILYFA